ncbi:hypothetical protein [Streptomyces alanosinicus]|nr:hypothetical protein [Streptomyces alanosinicus]
MKSKGQRHLHALDLGAALALTAVYAGFARLTSDDGQPACTGQPWPGCLIAVRRRWPLAVLAAVPAALARHRSSTSPVSRTPPPGLRPPSSHWPSPPAGPCPHSR